MDETITIFISSRQDELKDERTWAKEAVKETGDDLGKSMMSILVEHVPGPPRATVLDQCFEELKKCRVVICIYYKTISEIVKKEFHWANDRGIPIFIFKKDPQRGDEVDDELESFIEHEVRPPLKEPAEPYGIYVYKPFNGKDIKNEIKASLKMYYPQWFNFKPLPKKYIPSAERLKRTRHVYVKPSCYSVAEKKLKDNHLVIITGPAHLGKTSMGFYLADSFQKTISRRFLIFPENEDLSEMADIRDSIILFDDPFGGVKYSEVGLIGDKFDRLQELANKDKNNYVIVTTRKDVLNDAIKYTKLCEKNLKDKTIEMTPDNYSNEDFAMILERHLEHFEAGANIRTLAEIHKDEILRELSFPHNYDVLVKEELKNVIKGEKNFREALKDAKEIERAVGQWFENWCETNKEVFCFILILTLYGELEEEDFLRVWKKGIEKLKKEMGQDVRLPHSGDFDRLRKKTASYVSQTGLLRLEHTSYAEGIMQRIRDLYSSDAIVVVREIAEDINLVHFCTHAAETLGVVGTKHPKEVLPILERLAGVERDFILISIAANTLGKLGKQYPEKVIPILKRLVVNKDHDVQYHAAQNLIYVGRQHPNKLLFSILECLAKSKNFEVRDHVAMTLGKEGKQHPEKVVPILKRLVKNRSFDVRLSALRALEIMGRENPREIIPILKDLARDEDPDISSHAKGLLEDLGVRV